MVQLFSLAGFIITFREILEACIVVSICLAYLRRTKNERYLRDVWLGVAAGVGVLIVIGIAFGIVFWTRGQKLYTGLTELLFEAIVRLVAVVLITWMIFWMLSTAAHMRRDLEGGIARALSRRGRWGVALLVFTSVLREGVELIVFLFGITGGVSWSSIPIAAAVGVAVALVVAWAIYRGALAFDLRLFFALSSLLLIAFAAGFLSTAFLDLQKANLFGAFTRNGNEDESIPSTERPWWNAALWSTEACCADDGNEFFNLLHELFGYVDAPTFVSTVVYFGYWTLAGVLWIIVERRTLERKLCQMHTGYLVSTAFLAVAAMVGLVVAARSPTWNGILVTCLTQVLAIIGVGAASAPHAALPPRARFALQGSCWIGLVLVACLALALQVAQAICSPQIGASQYCSIPDFYYWFVIFSPDWIAKTRDDNSFHALAVLTVSICFTMLFCLGQGLVGFYEWKRSALAMQRAGQAPAALAKEANTSSDLEGGKSTPLDDSSIDELTWEALDSTQPPQHASQIEISARRMLAD
ncbi:similar to high-affinity iron permease [Cyanidioschyzon merolae strain 10D]|uniref:Similar to high-affinity iron permease n=1 Tax=Cyanidioschyzon merolae (strain NIES-3377 / 10D) TaxID=280699 RepID=M1VD58_CYAM1|nr:similar to high-affinity iron permease [Cyanidioschyzon merolae strain 10D]BAM80647.1 similar to high-affinity iron permease [Cyanidioschyzon merolae strain 10D]|eukprot:XP_005536683.1 similar to high-affinity iron permease [Cyanidioschyzon merolae strain 10D]